MGLEKTHGTNYNLSELLEGIDEGTVVLPDFQRDFDWTTVQVRQLLATVLLGWPLGSLLVLPGTGDTFFRLREFENAPPMTTPKLVVLDGQQRLTALYYALHGRGKGRYAVRIDVLGKDQSVEDLEESIQWFTDVQWKKNYSTPSEQYGAGLLPVTALRSASDFYEWRDDATSTADVLEIKNVTNTYKYSLAGLHKYEVPAAVINPDVPGTAVARIFERVNRLGRQLGTFDLVVAKSYTKSFNLRDKWDEACRTYPYLGAFLEDDGLPVLNVISLRTDESVRAQAVLDLTGDAVRDNWDQAVAATNTALEFAVTKLGVWESDWFPYKPLLTILAGLSLDIDLSSEEEGLRRWFWATTFSAAFDVASNTRAIASYKSLKENPGYLDRVSLNEDDFLLSNKKQFGAIHRAFASYLASRAPLDLASSERLFNQDEGLLPEVGTLSVFPRASAIADEPVHLRTLGTVLVSSADEKKYSFVDLSECDPATYERQLITPDFDIAAGPDAFFAMRLRNLHQSLAMDVGLDVKIVNRD
ncbi:DUF262 domain-containing protein [Clavibacter michiganensis subsp. michiganensis]|uniref:GmrSD restriction endonuclease domain-containing protein n=1 Tax=Clavibacter michiganensis TaxID=28447 RepID=UPI000B6C90F0|nr:DUF262 domain-containing protein [Clavibacter michiganensis]MWJ18738.1 DUF262 domain-containing protein [Clavibacter michiganensis subsp. michiganensis]OUD97928.1 hypothetical protein CMMCAS06_07030 [Clavibacter michiganensis subsp. michiganensis]OUE01896.1 hypothetical protein CMMCAS08_13470 [Clavibacter michiganensis subsp. michiganensis]